MWTGSGWLASQSIFVGWDRSTYLRATLPVMASLPWAERMRELQGRNAGQSWSAVSPMRT
jgi:hypothetical protein